MDIFESLENLNVSEECFEDIVGLVEKYLNEGDTSTRNSRGIDKFNANRLKKVEQREKGRTEYLKKNISDLLKGVNATKGVIPKVVDKETSLYKPNISMNPNNPESGLSKAKRRHEDKIAKQEKNK